MLVKDWMSKNVITTEAGDSIDAAEKMLSSYNIHSLPVVTGDQLTGIITTGDIKRASVPSLESGQVQDLSSDNTVATVGDIMTKNVKTARLLNTISETIDMLLKNRILGMPVIGENRSITGIITKTDIFKAMISLTSMDKQGIDIGFESEDRPGSIKEITDIVRDHGGRIASILASYEQAPVGYRNIHLRVYDIDQQTLRQIRPKLLRRTTLRYIIDPSEHIRELY
jgi:acetoin utilization protein AcuB